MTESPVHAGSPSLGERITDVFVAPSKAMEATAHSPAWWLPALVAVVVVAAFTYVNVDTITPAQLEAQLESASGQQVEVLEQQLDMFADPPSWLRLISGAGAGIGVFLGGTIFALLCHLFLKLSEGQARVGQSMGVVFWAGLIAYGLKTILQWLVLVTTGSVKFMTLTLAVLLPGYDPGATPFLLAGFYGDPFVWWMLFVVVVGMARAHQLTARAAATVVLATYGLLTAVMIGIQVISKSFSGA